MQPQSNVWYCGTCTQGPLNLDTAIKPPNLKEDSDFVTTGGVIIPDCTMAELAIAAAAAQFIDLGGSILSSLSKIIAECRDAPHRISTLRGEVQQLIELVRITQSNAGAAAVFNTSFDKEVLSDTIGTAQRLHRLLGELPVDSDKGLAVRTWAAIRTMQKDRELSFLCEGLERQKTNLSIWFANHNL